MRILDCHEWDQVSGGARATPKDPEIVRADPGEDVRRDHPGRATGWCRGFGNLKPGENKHADKGKKEDCGCQPPQ